MFHKWNPYGKVREACVLGCMPPSPFGKTSLIRGDSQCSKGRKEIVFLTSSQPWQGKLLKKKEKKTNKKKEVRRVRRQWKGPPPPPPPPPQEHKSTREKNIPHPTPPPTPKELLPNLNVSKPWRQTLFKDTVLSCPCQGCNNKAILTHANLKPQQIPSLVSRQPLLYQWSAWVETDV